MDEDQVERATTFSGSEAPGGERLDESESYRNYYNKLSIYNRPEWNGSWVDEEGLSKKGRDGIVDAIASSMELTEPQTNKAHRIFSEIEVDDFGGYATSTYAVCACAIAAEERNYHYNQVAPQAAVDNLFTELVDELDIRYKILARVWHRVEGKL